MNNQQAVMKYEFVGYRLVKADYSRLQLGVFKGFNIANKKKEYDEKNHIFELITEFTLTTEGEVSKLIFSAGFRIIDLNWYEIMSTEAVINDLFEVAYPFFREKIFAITSDFRPGILLPTFDMNQFDFSKNIQFNLEFKKKEEVKDNKDVIN